MEILVKLLQAYLLQDAQENALINKIRKIYEFIWIFFCINTNYMLLPDDKVDDNHDHICHKL